MPRVPKYDLPMWVIYKNPSDFPGKFVARLHTVDGPTTVHFIADTLEEARKCIPRDFVFLPRFEQDERHIVETWI